MGTRYLIVGGGVAAVNAAQAIRKYDTKGKVQIYCKEDRLPYFRIKLSKDLFTDLSSEKVLIKNAKWYESNDIQVFTNRKITRINPIDHIALDANKEQISYDKLLICTGSKNRKLDIEGTSLKGVFNIREIPEAEEFKEYIKDKKHIVIIGGGVQGVETAWALMKEGKRVTIVEVFPILMGRQLDEITSAMLLERIKASGGEVILGSSVQGIVGEDCVRGVEIEKRGIIECDSVLYSVGVVPNIELVKDTPIASNRGIIVDEMMRTNVEDVFAAGDVVEFQNEVVGLWSTAMEQGTVAGSNMAGASLAFNKSIPTTIFRSFDLKIFSMGLVDESKCDRIITEENNLDNYTKLFIKDRKIVGVISLGGIAEATPFKKLIENQIIIDKINLEDISVSKLMEALK